MSAEAWPPAVDGSLAQKQSSDAHYTGHGSGTPARAHVQECPLSRISETAGWIALKFGMWFRDTLAGRFTEVKGEAQQLVRNCIPLFPYLGND